MKKLGFWTIPDDVASAIQSENAGGRLFLTHKCCDPLYRSHDLRTVREAAVGSSSAASSTMEGAQLALVPIVPAFACSR